MSEAISSREAGKGVDYPLAFSIGAAIRTTQRQFAQELQDRLAPYDIPIGMWYFFRALWEEDGLTQRQLSQRVGAMEQTTVEQLRNMERRGYVERRRSLDDRRKVHVHLTESGSALKSQLLPFAIEVNQTALDGLSDGEIGFLRLVLDRIRGNLEKQQARRRDSIRRGPATSATGAPA
ncbi:MAG TPA: MarR family transcriptional regulator [Aliidongia sp.]|uniref:MarR family winged helix-turn-helix transcriptional regulator n=1 Tax=Aliidongia sp. TaxID=1914230 RepID=UPI002DDD84AF|nr:MarR family transcriptional regulator [Aliidongia sp.]HEV2677058.1 MarR family transcriptional regulator [Aliidongia sp.]